MNASVTSAGGNLTTRLFTRIAPYFPCIAVFLVTFAAKLLLIQQYGNDMPFWDQWNAEGGDLYPPLLEHGWGAVHWFAPHNEHRIALTRLTAVLLLEANGQWDAIVQTVFNAALHSLVAALLAFIVIRHITDGAARALLILIVAVGIAMPYGSENTLGGFQSQFYYFLLISVVLLHWSSTAQRFSLGSMLAILALGAVSLFTVASGAIACFMTAVALGYRAFVSDSRQERFRLGLLAAVLVALFFVGVLITPTVPHHLALRPTSLHQWLSVFKKAAIWPLSTNFGLLLWLPYAVLLVRIFRRGLRSITSFELFVIVFGGFVLANDAALALSRGATEETVANFSSRYRDVLWLCWLVNASALACVAATLRSPVLRTSLVSVFAFVALAALAKAGWNSIGDADWHKSMRLIGQRNVLNFVLTHDYANLADKPPVHIPFPHADYLRDRLLDPTVQRILPPGIRGGVLGNAPQSADNSFLSPGTYGSVPSLTPRPVYGSFGPNGDGYTGKFVSAPIELHGGSLQFEIAGYLGRPGLRLALESEPQGKVIPITVSAPPAETWVRVAVHVPQGRYRIVAEDASTDFQGWFAFSDPVEVGPLRVASESLLRRAPSLILLSAVLLLVCVVTTCRYAGDQATAKPPQPTRAVEQQSPNTVPDRTGFAWRSLFIGLLVPACAALMSLLSLTHAPLLVHNPILWAEDGGVFIPHAALGLGAFLEPHAGYLHLLPRLLAVPILQWVQIENYAYAAVALYVLGLAVALWFVLTTSTKLVNRIALCLALVVLCPPGEVVGNLTNLQWIYAVVLALAVVENRTEVRRPFWLSMVVIALGAFSGPFSIFAWVIATLVYRRDWLRRPESFVVAAGAITQVITLVLSATSADASPMAWTDGVNTIARIFSTPYWLLMLCAVVAYAIAARSNQADRSSARMGVFMLLYCTAILLSGFIKYSSAGKLAGFAIGDGGSRFFFTAAGLLMLVLLYPSPRRLLALRALIFTIASGIGLLHYMNPFAQDPWAWRYSVARAEVLDETVIQGAPPFSRYAKMTINDRMRGFGARYGFIKTHVSPVRDQSAPSCLGHVDVVTPLPGTGGAHEFAGWVWASDGHRAVDVVLLGNDDAVRGYGPILTRRPDVPAAIDAVHSETVGFRAYVAGGDAPSRLLVIDQDGSALCNMPI